MRHLNGGIGLHQDPMSPQIMLRRHASSAAALSERKETATNSSSSSKEQPFRCYDGGVGQHSVKKRPPPARPPLPARMRSISHQPLPGHLSEFTAASCRDVRSSQVYVSSTSRICLARTLDGLVDAPKLDGCRPQAPLPPPAAGRIHAMRNVVVDDRVETQAVACWLEGSSFLLLRLIFFAAQYCGHDRLLFAFFALSPLPGCSLSVTFWLWKRTGVIRESDKSPMNFLFLNVHWFEF